MQILLYCEFIRAGRFLIGDRSLRMALPPGFRERRSYTSHMIISGGEYEANIRLNGGGLSKLTFRNRNIVEPYSTETNSKYFGGALLAPWPNRVRDGRYMIGGTEYQLPINEGSRNNALHGLIDNLEWFIHARSDSELELETTLAESAAYPSSLQMKVRYRLSERGLEWRLRAKNIGEKQVPYGASIHPYLVAESGSKVNDWLLELPAEEVLKVDLERLLPIELRRVDREELDFRKKSLINVREIDHAFKVVESPSERKIEVTGPTGEGVRIYFDSASSWIQIHTADRDGDNSGRSCLAVEPMSCPPDAFNSGTNLVMLSPGEEHLMNWRIEAIKQQI